MYSTSDYSWLCASCVMQGKEAGTWTCILCLSDGPALSLTCPGQCRACKPCYMASLTEGADCTRPQHRCCRTAEQVQFLIESSGCVKGVLAFPDVGWGRVEWLKTGLKWPQLGRGMWCVESTDVLSHLANMKEIRDPLQMVIDVQAAYNKCVLP